MRRISLVWVSPLALVGLSYACRTVDTAAVKDEAPAETPDSAEAGAVEGVFVYSCQFASADFPAPRDFQAPFTVFSTQLNRTTLALMTDSGQMSEGAPFRAGSFLMSNAEGLGLAPHGPTDNFGQVTPSIPMTGGSKTGTISLLFPAPALPSGESTVRARYKCDLDQAASSATSAKDAPTCDAPAANGSLTCKAATAGAAIQNFVLTLNGPEATAQPKLSTPAVAKFVAGFKTLVPRLASACKYFYAGTPGDFLLLSPDVARGGDGRLFFRSRPGHDTVGDETYDCKRK